MKVGGSEMSWAVISLGVLVWNGEMGVETHVLSFFLSRTSVVLCQQRVGLPLGEPPSTLAVIGPETVPGFSEGGSCLVLRV